MICVIKYLCNKISQLTIYFELFLVWIGIILIEIELFLDETDVDENKDFDINPNCFVIGNSF